MSIGIVLKVVVVVANRDTAVITMILYVRTDVRRIHVHTYVVLCYCSFSKGPKEVPMSYTGSTVPTARDTQ